MRSEYLAGVLVLAAAFATALSKTLDALVTAYARACNKATVEWYAGGAGSLAGYTCKPVRGSVFILRFGSTLGSEPVELPWKWGTP